MKSIFDYVKDYSGDRGEFYLLCFGLEGYRLGLWGLEFLDDLGSGIYCLASLYSEISSKIGSIDGHIHNVDGSYFNERKNIFELSDLVYERRRSLERDISYYEDCIKSGGSGLEKDLLLNFTSKINLFGNRIKAFDSAYLYCEDCFTYLSSIDYMISYGDSVMLSFGRILFYNRLYHFLQGYCVNSDMFLD